MPMTSALACPHGPYRPRRSFALLPLQPALRRIVSHVAHELPELFERLGPHRYSTFIIDAIGLPFVLALLPDPANPKLRAFRRGREPAADARITGSFANLLALIDGGKDGDALFFSRDLEISGNLEAVVCLRNAIDDIEGSVAERVADLYRAPGRLALKAARQMGTRG